MPRLPLACGHCLYSAGAQFTVSAWIKLVKGGALAIAAATAVGIEGWAAAAEVADDCNSAGSVAIAIRFPLAMGAIAIIFRRQLLSVCSLKQGERGKEPICFTRW
jgi:hypothetical protein